MYSYLILLHILGATVWTGGHIILATLILPAALRDKSVESLIAFESKFERIGIPSLIIQIVTGVWLAKMRIPELGNWFEWSDPNARLVSLKLALLLTTAMLAVDARFRLIPRLSEDKLFSLALHIIPVTLLSIGFVIVGITFRGVSWY